MEFITSYKTTLPLDCNSPSIKIKNYYDKPLKVIFKCENEIVFSKLTFGSELITCSNRQFFSSWEILVEDYYGNVIFKDNNFNLIKKKVFIKIDSKALGDTIAWMPYVEEFRKKHNCELICSSFYNDLFIKSYPNITFKLPNTDIDDIHTQIYVGASDKYSYCPIKIDENNLQKVASSILAVEYKENLKPIINFDKFLIVDSREYVCLSLSSSYGKKNYGDDEFWTKIISNLNVDVYLLGFINLDLYPKLSSLSNVKLNFVGVLNDDILLNIISNSKMMIGFSSGLSWLSWALNVLTILISTVTPFIHEPSNVVRIGDPNLTKINYNNKFKLHEEDILKKIKNHL